MSRECSYHFKNYIDLSLIIPNFDSPQLQLQKVINKLCKNYDDNDIYYLYGTRFLNIIQSKNSILSIYITPSDVYYYIDRDQFLKRLFGIDNVKTLILPDLRKTKILYNKSELNPVIYIDRNLDQYQLQLDLFLKPRIYPTTYTNKQGININININISFQNKVHKSQNHYGNKLKLILGLSNQVHDFQQNNSNQYIDTVYNQYNQLINVKYKDDIFSNKLIKHHIKQIQPVLTIPFFPQIDLNIDDPLLIKKQYLYDYNELPLQIQPIICVLKCMKYIIEQYTNLPRSYRQLTTDDNITVKKTTLKINNSFIDYLYKLLPKNKNRDKDDQINMSYWNQTSQNEIDTLKWQSVQSNKIVGLNRFQYIIDWVFGKMFDNTSLLQLTKFLNCYYEFPHIQYKNMSKEKIRQFGLTSDLMFYESYKHRNQYLIGAISSNVRFTDINKPESKILKMEHRSFDHIKEKWVNDTSMTEYEHEYTGLICISFYLISQK